MNPMTRTPPREATYDDVLALPEHVVGEIVDGELVVSPRPAPLHALAAAAIAEELGPPFKRGRGGPGGWVILFEPELHLGKDVLVPDVAGWRRERMPEVPIELPYFTLAADWVCEVLSPSTARLDRTRKLAAYARNRVGHVWFVDGLAQTLEVLRLDGDTYRIVLTAAAAERVRAEPFDAIELDLAILWQR
jgi:Uma2 family endonuclease